MCAGRNQQTRTNEMGFHIARTCTNVRIADTGVEPVISCLGGKRGYPFHSSAAPYGGVEPPSRFRPNA